MNANKPTLASAVHEAPPKIPVLPDRTIGNGDVLIAAITSCTNTSNPSVMIGAGLLAKKAVEAGLTVEPHIKTSLAPGSRIVTEYLTKAGLLPYLDKLGFGLAAYGCTTCIGNAGDLTPEINETITKNDLVCAAVLSGNRNFEARIHPNLKANFLASPPLVVAYAIAGTVLKDLMTEPVGKGKGGRDVYLGDIWPTSDEVAALMKFAMNGKRLPRQLRQGRDATRGRSGRRSRGVTGQVYNWPPSTYIAKPPFFDGFEMTPPPPAAAIQGARAMALFGDSITTDHISPAGAIKESSPAGMWLKEHGVTKADFNSLRLAPRPPRGDDARHLRQRADQEPDDPARRRRLARGRRGDAVPALGREDVHLRRGDEVHGRRDADDRLRRRGVRHRIEPRLGGQGHAAARHQGRRRAQLRAHPPLATWSAWACCRCSSSRATRGNRSASTATRPSTSRSARTLRPQQDATLVVHAKDGAARRIPLVLRIDTAIEVDYYRHGGILPFVLRQLLAA